MAAHPSRHWQTLFWGEFIFPARAVLLSDCWKTEVQSTLSQPATSESFSEAPGKTHGCLLLVHFSQCCYVRVISLVFKPIFGPASELIDIFAVESLNLSVLPTL